MKTATNDQEEQLRQAIKGLLDVKPSVPESEFQDAGFTANNSGSGTQTNYHSQGKYIAQGEARQYNTGGGAMNFGRYKTI